MTRFVVPLLLAFGTACGGAGAPPREPQPQPTAEVDAAVATPDPEPANYTAGPAGIPLPLDATAATQPGMNTEEIKSFMVPRGKDEVVTELRANLAADGWEVTGEEISPRGAVRLDVMRDGTTIKVRATGDDTRTAIIITLP